MYVYGVLSWLTNGGADIRLAQWIFAGLYIATLAVVLAIYRRARILPPWALGLLALSKRVHSIFVLRLFNDPIAMLPLYSAVLLAMHDQWLLASLGLTCVAGRRARECPVVPRGRWVGA